MQLPPAAPPAARRQLPLGAPPAARPDTQISIDVGPASGCKTGFGAATVVLTPGNLSCEAATGEARPCKFWIPYGSMVTLKASSQNGTRFLGWARDCGDKKDTCTLQMNGDKHVTAGFCQEIL
jgi:hypothetical protein